MTPPYYSPRAYPLRPNDEATGRNSIFATDEIAAEYADLFGGTQPSAHFASKAIEDEYKSLFSGKPVGLGYDRPYPDQGFPDESDAWRFTRDDGSQYSDAMLANARAAQSGKSSNGVPLSDEQRLHVTQLALPLVNKKLHDIGVREEAADPAQSAEPQLRGLPSLIDQGRKKGRRRGSLDKVARTWLPTLTSIDANMEMSAAVKRIEEGNSDLKDWALMANVDKELKEAEIAAKDNSQIWNVAKSVITSLPETVLLFWAGAGVGGKLGAGLIKSKLGRALPKALRTHTGRAVKGALNPVATPAWATEKFTSKRTPELEFKEGKAVAGEVPGAWSALRDSLGSAMLTGAVEAAGGRLSGKVASKIRKTPGFDKLANSDAVRPFLERYVKVTEKLNTPLTKKVRAALKRGGFDSVLPEVFEERLEEVLQGAAGFEDNYGATGELVSGVKSLDPEMIGNAVQTVLGELVGIGLFGAGVRAPAIAADLTAKGVGAVAERGTRRSEGRKNAIGLLLDQQAEQEILSSAERWGQENPELARDLSESPSRSEFNAALKDSGIESPPATDIGVRSDFAVLARRAADLQSDVVEQPIAEGERVETTDVIEAPAEVEGDQLPPGDDPTPTEAALEPWQMTKGEFEKGVDPEDPRGFPLAGETVSGLTVREEVPNMASIRATYEDYTILKGVREVFVTELESPAPKKSALAQDIKDSGEINPLIVAIDEGGLSILEGAHRMDAIRELGLESFPAVVVIDKAAHRVNVQQALSAGKPVPAEVLAEYPDLAPTEATPAEKPPKKDNLEEISREKGIPHGDDIQDWINNNISEDDFGAAWLLLTGVEGNIHSEYDPAKGDLKNFVAGAIKLAKDREAGSSLEHVSTEMVDRSGVAEHVPQDGGSHEEAEEAALNFLRGLEGDLRKRGRSKKFIDSRMMLARLKATTDKKWDEIVEETNEKHGTDLNANSASKWYKNQRDSGEDLVEKGRKLREEEEEKAAELQANNALMEMISKIGLTTTFPSTAKERTSTADTPKKSKGKKKKAEVKPKYARKTPGEESDATNAEIRKAMDEAFREDRKAEELQRIQKEKAAGQEEIDDLLKEIAKEVRNTATAGLNPKLVKLAAKVVVKYVKFHVNTSFEEFKVRVKYSDAASDMQDYLKRAWDLYQEDIGRYRALPTFERLPEELADYGKYLDKVTGAANRLNKEVAGSVFSEEVDWPKQINQAREKIEENPRIVQDTIDDILAHEFNVNELNFQVVLQNVLSIEVRVRQDAVDDIEEKGSRGEMVPLDDQKEREERLEQVQKANRLYGTVSGRGQGARNITLTDEYHIDSMHNFYKREFGAEATGEDKKVIKKHSQAIRKSEKKFNAREEQDIQGHVENEIDLSVASAKRETRKEKSRKLSAKSKAARKKFKNKVTNLLNVPGMMDLSLSAAKLVQIPEVLVAAIELGAVTFQQAWHIVIPELRDGYREKGVELTAERLNAWHKAMKEQWGKLKEKPESYVDIDNPSSITALARKIQYDIIASGVLPSGPPKATRDMLVPLVQEALSEATGSEFTRQETEHALAKYGQYTPLTEDVIKRKRADINSQLLAKAQLETVEGGELPLMTGSEPYPISDETRRIRREVYQAKKGLDDAKYREGLHKSAVASELTRMRNFIADMEEAIRLGKPMDDGTRRRLEGDELDDMRKQIEEVKERYKEHFPPEGKTAEQQLKASLESVEGAIEKAEEDIKTMKGGSLPASTVKVVVESEQLTQRRAYLKELRSERTILKAELLDPKKESIEERRDRIYRARLIRQRDEYDRRIANREFVSPKRKKRDRKMSNETLKAHSEWEKSKQAWKKEQRKFLRKKMGIWDRAYDIVKETAYLSTAITTSVDAGALFRQAGGAAVAHPSIAMKNFGIAVDAALSKKSLAEHERDFKNRPRYEYYIRAGLAIRDQLTEGEEAFLSQWAKHLPTIGPILESSEVFHGTFLSIMRADLFDLMCHSVSPNGHLEINEAKQIANFVNQLTGRATFNSNSKIARALEAICRQTAWVFFSPRWVLSRFQLVSTFAKLLLPETLSGMSPRVKKVIAKEYGRTFGGYAVMTGAIYLLAPLLFADDDDEEVSYGTDWMSAEIGKVIVGDTRIDATFGMSTSLVFFSRMFTFSEDSDGRLKSKALRRFMRSKLAPVAGSVTDLWFSKNDHFATNLFGEEVSPWKMAINLATPLMVRDIHENMVKRGMPGSAALSMLAAVGVNSNTYGDRTDFVTAEPADRPKVIEKYLKNMGPTDDPNETWDERPSFWNMIDQRKLGWDKRFEREKTKKWAKVVLDGVTEMEPERTYNRPTPYKEYVEKKREDFNKMIERLIPLTQSNTRNREELLSLALDLVKEDRVKYEPTYKDGVWNGGYKTTPMSSSVGMERRKRITTSFKNHWESE